MNSCGAAMVFKVNRDLIQVAGFVECIHEIVGGLEGAFLRQAAVNHRITRVVGKLPSLAFIERPVAADRAEFAGNVKTASADHISAFIYRIELEQVIYLGHPYRKSQVCVSSIF